MEMLLQDSAWSCLPTAFAMATNTLPKDIYQFIGHKGDDVIWPELKDPKCRRCFHIDEMIDYCVSICFFPVCITVNPATLPKGVRNAHFIHTPKQAEARLSNYLETVNAVLVGYTKEGKRHAVAWSRIDQEIFDPNGTRYSILEFEIEHIYLLFTI